jgi:hypothetical protein
MIFKRQGRGQTSSPHRATAVKQRRVRASSKICERSMHIPWFRDLRFDTGLTLPIGCLNLRGVATGFVKRCGRNRVSCMQVASLRDRRACLCRMLSRPRAVMVPGYCSNSLHICVFLVFVCCPLEACHTFAFFLSAEKKKEERKNQSFLGFAFKSMTNARTEPVAITTSNIKR